MRNIFATDIKFWHFKQFDSMITIIIVVISLQHSV